MVNDGQVLFLQIRPPHHYLRRYPGHAPLKHGKLSFALARFPFTVEAGIETAVDVIHTSREPLAEDILAEHLFSFVRKLQIIFFGRSDVGYRLSRNLGYGRFLTAKKS